MQERGYGERKEEESGEKRETRGWRDVEKKQSGRARKSE